MADDDNEIEDDNDEEVDDAKISTSIPTRISTTTTSIVDEDLDDDDDDAADDDDDEDEDEDDDDSSARARKRKGADDDDDDDDDMVAPDDVEADLDTILKDRMVTVDDDDDDDDDDDIAQPDEGRPPSEARPSMASSRSEPMRFSVPAVSSSCAPTLPGVPSRTTTARSSADMGVSAWPARSTRRPRGRRAHVFTGRGPASSSARRPHRHLGDGTTHRSGE